MENVKFITDSSSDLSAELAKKLDIEIVPMGIVINGEAHLEGVDFTTEEFYKILSKQKKIPTTSAINPQKWYEIIEKNLLSGKYNRLSIVTVGRALSASNHAAEQAREQIMQAYPTQCEKIKIDIYDSGSASIGYGYPITQGIEMLKKGISYGEVSEYLMDWFHSLEVYFVAFSLDIPRKSGRINAATAYIGEKLSIRPIMRNMDGVFTVYGKARGDSQVVKKLRETVKERMRSGSPYIFLNGTHPTIGQTMQQAMLDLVRYPVSLVVKPGPAMVINARICFALDS